MHKDELTVSTLGNGIIIGTHEFSGKLSRENNPVSIVLYTAAGTAHEDYPGAAHSMEHNQYKGTDTRSALQVAKDFARIGDGWNATTCHDHICNSVDIQRKHLATGMDLTVGVSRRPTFPTHELTIERKTILNEQLSAFDNAEDYIMELTDRACFKDSPYGRSIFGTKTSIRNTTRQHVHSFWQDHYSQSQKIFFAAGEVSHNEFTDYVEKSYGDLKFLEPKKPPIAVFNPTFAIEPRELEHVEMSISFKGVGRNDKNKYGLMMISALMAEGLSSRLVQEIREKRGLTYSISAFSTVYNEGGAFSIVWSTATEDAMRVVPLVVDELTAAGNSKKFTEEEFLCAKEQMLQEISFESSDAPECAERMCFDLFAYGRVISPQERIAEIEKLDLDQINKLAVELFSSKWAYAAVGPQKEINQCHEWLNKHFKAT